MTSAPTGSAPSGDARSAAEEMSGSVVRGGAWQSSGRVLGQIYTLFVSIVAARVLGAEQMGRLVFIAYVYTTIVAILAAGLPIAVNRFTAEVVGAGRAGAIRGIYVWALRIEAVGAALGGGILVSIFLLGGQPGGAWLAAAAACSASVLQTIPNAVLLGAQRWREASVIGLVSGTVGAAAKLALLGAGQGITSLLAVDAGVALVNLVVATWLVRRTLAPIAPDPLPVSELLRRARTYAFGSTVGVLLSLVVLQRSEILFLQRFSDDVQIALYSIPFSAVETLTVVPSALGIAAASAFAALFGAGAHERMRLGFGRAVRLTLLLTLPITAASMVLGPDALRLAYGEEYDGTAPVLLILVVVFPVISLMFVSTALVQGFGRQRAPLAILGVAAVVAVTLDLVLIPSLEAIGAAVANASSQAVASLLLLAYAARLAGGIAWEAGSLLRVVGLSLLCAGAGLAPVVALDPLPGFLVGGLAFLAALTVLAPVVRVVPRQDGRWLEDSVRSRFGSAAARVVRVCTAPD